MSKAAGPPEEDALGRLTMAEAVAVSVITVLVSAVAASYLLDRFGVTIAPVPVLLLSLVCGAATLAWRPARPAGHQSKAALDLVAFAGIVLAVLAALLWLAWPDLLPIGGGSDLTHHLQLIDFIDRHWRLAHAAADALLVGNMVNYTPGSHLLAAVAGAWVRSDGLHAVYLLVASSVALKAGLVFLIVRRVLNARGRTSESLRTPLAIGGVLLLFLPYDYFIGAFARFSFLAQVVSEMFAVAMWLALVLWNERPSAQAAAIFGIAGVGVFLTWPVWIGPPILVLLALVVAGGERWSIARWRYLAWALAPIAIAAALHAFGRAESVAIVQTGGAAFAPTVSRFGWPFLLLTAAGSVIAVRDRSNRVTVMLLAAVVLQTLGLLLAARVGGADSPYMALKMPHFAIYPMAAAAVLPISAAFQLFVRVVETAASDGWLKRHGMDALAWVTRGRRAAPQQGRGSCRRPAQRRRSRRMCIAPADGHGTTCNPTASSTSFCTTRRLYWLHHAVLGNPMQPAPGAAPPVFFYRVALVRWITGTSFPVTIADLSVIPREVREDLDVLARFGHVVVGRRHGPTACAGR